MNDPDHRTRLADANALVRMCEDAWRDALAVRDRQIRAMVRDGWTISAVAAASGLTRQRVSQITHQEEAR